jgi:hypothetical protein
MTHEQKIDRCESEMLAAKDPEARREWGAFFLAAIMDRNADRTPAEVAELERQKGLRA